MSPAQSRRFVRAQSKIWINIGQEFVLGDFIPGGNRVDALVVGLQGLQTDPCSTSSRRSYASQIDAESCHIPSTAVLFDDPGSLPQ